MTCTTPQPVTGYVPLAGTNGWRDGWCTHDDDPFALMMAAEGFRVMTRPDGSRYRWSTFLDGVLGDDRTWITAGEAAADFLEAHVPFAHRNLIGHSHGGNVALHAATLVPVRSITTIGTPHRKDGIDYQRACDNCLYWQHIFDRKKDLIAWLGQIKLWDGDFVDGERRMLVIPRGGINLDMQNFGLDGICHSRLLRDPQFLHYWRVSGWLENVRDLPMGPGQLAAGV